MEKKLLYFVALFALLTATTYLFIKSPEPEKTLYTDFNTSHAYWKGNATAKAESLKAGKIIYLGKDTTTKGAWPGVYGSHTYIIPNPDEGRTGIPIGEFTIPEDRDFYDYGWTGEHVDGLPLNRTEPPYWDKYHSQQPGVNYTLTGTRIEGPEGLIQLPAFEWAWETSYQNPHRDDRALYIPGEEGFRLTSWFDGSERGFPLDGYFTVSLSFPEGKYLLSLYGVDVERQQRSNQTITVTTDRGSETRVMDARDFDEGVYLLYVVRGPAEVAVKVVKEPDSINAVLSGIFIDAI